MPDPRLARPWSHGCRAGRMPCAANRSRVFPANSCEHKCKNLKRQKKVHSECVQGASGMTRCSTTTCCSWQLREVLRRQHPLLEGEDAGAGCSSSASWLDEAPAVLGLVGDYTAGTTCLLNRTGALKCSCTTS